MAIKKKYLDDDTREELKDLKGVIFESEEELNEKLDEIHRKRNNRKISRIMRLLGFVLALVLFFAAFDVYFESSFLGAIFTPEDYAFSLESMKQTNNMSANGVFHGYTKGSKYYVLKEYDPLKHTTVTEHAWNSMSSDDADDYCEVYVYTVHYNGTRSHIISLDVSRDYDGTVSSATLRNNYDFLRKYPAPNSPTYDDWWWFGTGFVALLNTIIILGLGMLLVYIFVFMIKDFVDAVKFTFIGTRNNAAELIETASTAVGAVKKKKKEEEEPEPVRSNKKLFDDEEPVPATPKKKRVPKKVEEPEVEEKKETQPLYNDDELDRLLKGENISANTETEAEPRRRSLFDD
jgi:hypothetical protein